MVQGHQSRFPEILVVFAKKNCMILSEKFTKMSVISPIHKNHITVHVFLSAYSKVDIFASLKYIPLEYHSRKISIPGLNTLLILKFARYSFSLVSEFAHQRVNTIAQLYIRAPHEKVWHQLSRDYEWKLI